MDQAQLNWINWITNFIRGRAYTAFRPSARSSRANSRFGKEAATKLSGLEPEEAADPELSEEETELEEIG